MGYRKYLDILGIAHCTVCRFDHDCMLREYEEKEPNELCPVGYFNSLHVTHAWIYMCIL